MRVEVRSPLIYVSLLLHFFLVGLVWQLTSDMRELREHVRLYDMQSAIDKLNCKTQLQNVLGK